MSKTILTDVKGFTPVIDELVKELGLMPAVIFGRIWRYCQMKDGVCSASLSKIGEEVGVSRKTVERYAKVLCAAGYLDDTTPKRRNRPHVYKDTGKVQVWSQLATSKRSDRESDQDDYSDRESECSDRESDPGKTESRMKIEKDRTQDTLTGSQIMFGILAEICNINWQTTTEAGAKGRGALNESEKILREAGVNPQDLRAFGDWWYEHDWRGQKGQSPTPAQVRQEWGAFEKHRNRSRYRMEVGA